MEAYNYKLQPYAYEGSPATEIMLAEYNPKKRAGRKKFRETRHPVYRGIRQRNSGKWVCEVREPKKKNRIWLGTFPTAEMAARAHDVAAMALRGRSACLNFADSTWRLPVPASGDTKDIQLAAAKAAEAFRPRSKAEEQEEETNAAAASVSGEEGKMGWLDEEIFGLPEILTDMYNGMMMSPPNYAYVADEYAEYDQHYSTDQSSSATEISNPPPPPPEVMLAEYNPKKRAGRKKFKETRHPVYRGIRQRNVDKWVCETREPNKKTRIWLGTYPTAEMAARAYDVAAIALRGRSACLNFADSAWRLPVPASSDTKHIQQAAAEAAELFRPGYQAAADASSSAVGEEGDHMGWMDDYLSGMPDLFGETSNDGLPPAPPAPEYADMAQYDYGFETSPATDNSSPPMQEVMLAEYNPKKRAGRKKFKETRHPIYRGIRQRNNDKWVCETREPNKKTRIWLGTFPTAEMAARAHDVAAIALRGRSACLNFADSAWRLPIPASSDTKDIQRAAAEAAELFRPGYLAAEEEDSAAAAAAMPSSAAAEEDGNMEWMDEYLSGMPDILADMYNGAMPPPPPPEYADVADNNGSHWMDEDVFGMPEILADMYNGMMLPPPPQQDYADTADDYADLPLWNF
ncbi:hypothetical protein V2J09_014545 [Rumex salicifolius]